MATKNKKFIAKEMGTFLRQYGRKAQKGRDPNDRSYDTNIEWMLKRLKPEEVDLLINGEEDERLPPSKS